jgi:hypothetical protein
MTEATPGSVDAGNPNPTPTPNPAPAAAPAWYGEVDADTKGWIDSKGLKGVPETLTSYRNLERAYGADKAGRTVILPGENATAEETGAFYSKLGRPDAADKYELNIPEKADPKLVDWFKGTAHKHGLSTKQAAALFDDYNAMTGGAMTEQSEAAGVKSAAEMQSLQKEWGSAFDQKVATGKAAVKAFGVDDATIDRLQEGMGLAGVLKFFDAVGSKIGEKGFVAGDTSTGFGALTPGEAERQLREMDSDPEKRNRILGGDKTLIERRKMLQEQAYGRH